VTGYPAGVVAPRGPQLSAGTVVIALPMKIEGGTGGPLRIMAIVPRR
jgi:kynurenine formamidase